MRAFRQNGRWILGGVIVATLGLLAWQGRTLAGARAELTQWQGAAAELARLQAENHRLNDNQPTESELGKLRADLVNLERMRKEAAELRASTSLTSAAGEPTRPAPAIISAGAWKNAGISSPAAAVETALWAAAGGDVAALVTTIGFEPKLKASLERAFAQLPENVRLQYGSPEHMVAFFTVKDVPVGDMQILQERQAGDGEMEVTVRLRPEDQKSAKEVALTLKRFDGGWRLMVPPQAIQKHFDELGGALGGSPAERKKAKGGSL
jgi:hypothetical protein